jgi:hypothetical protein
MTENSISKMDIIIIIILSLLVAFIIGFNIIQLIDNKLSSVSINVPPTKCTIPPIYLNLDKDKTIKINDYINEETKLENMTNTENIIENYGNLPDDVTEMTKLDYQNISNNNATLIINKNDQDTISDLSDNYNTMNNLPFLVDPNNNKDGYLKNKVKLVENKNSPLLKLDKIYKNKINNNIKNCPPEKKLYDGYNKYNDLRKDNFANITAIGKNLIVPYTSYPIAS